MRPTIPNNTREDPLKLAVEKLCPVANNPKKKATGTKIVGNK